MNSPWPKNPHTYMYNVHVLSVWGPVSNVDKIYQSVNLVQKVPAWVLNNWTPSNNLPSNIYLHIGSGGSIEGDTVVHSATFTFCSHYRTSGHSMLNRSINCDLYYKTDITLNKRIVHPRTNELKIWTINKHW